jgi:hypothetical protein
VDGDDERLHGEGADDECGQGSTSCPAVPEAFEGAGVSGPESGRTNPSTPGMTDLTCDVPAANHSRWSASSAQQYRHLRRSTSAPNSGKRSARHSPALLFSGPVGTVFAALVIGSASGPGGLRASLRGPRLAHAPAKQDGPRFP